MDGQTLAHIMSTGAKAAAPEAQQPRLLPQRELRVPADQQQQGHGGGAVPAGQDGDLNASEEQGGGEPG